MSNKAYSMICSFIELCANSPVCNDIPCDSTDCRVTGIFLSLSLFMVQASKVALILEWIENVNNETCDCMWHAARMGKFTEKLEHYIEYCQRFCHPIMCISAFIAWVRHPSIFLTFILRKCHAFIISVTVVIRWSIIFVEHYLWHLITVNNSGTDFNPCSTGFTQRLACDAFQMGTLPYMSHEIDELELLIQHSLTWWWACVHMWHLGFFLRHFG